LLAASIPRTVEVLPKHAEAFWGSRRAVVFQAGAGFGGKAAYRGDKLTRRVFAELAAAATSRRRGRRPSGVCWSMASNRISSLICATTSIGVQVQLVSARLYRGQTTNFRTPGGGFASVVPVSCHAAAVGCRSACVSTN
jgi:hypothetical protein